MIRVSCTECEETLRVADEHAGARIRCKHCGAVNHVPDGLGGDVEDYDTGARRARRLPPKVIRPKPKPQAKTPTAGEQIAGAIDKMPRPVKMTIYAAGGLILGIVVAFAVAMVVPAAVAVVGLVLVVVGFILMLVSIFGLFYDAMVAYGPSLIPGGRLVRIVMFSIQHWEYAKVHYIRGGMCLLCFFAAMILSAVGQSAVRTRQAIDSPNSSRPVQARGTYGNRTPADSNRRPRGNTSRQSRPEPVATNTGTWTPGPTPAPSPTSSSPTRPKPRPAITSTTTPDRTLMPAAPAVPSRPVAGTITAPPQYGELPKLAPSRPLFGPEGRFEEAAATDSIQVYLGTAAAGDMATTQVAVYVPDRTGSGRLPCLLVPAEPPDALCGADIGDPASHPECIRHAQAGFVVVLFSAAGPRQPWSEADPAERRAAYEQFKKSEAGLADARAALALARNRLPIVDPDRLYTLGLRYGATVALLLAADAPELKGCVAYKPVADRAEWFANEAKDAGPLADAAELKAFLEQSSPRHQFQRIRCPVLLMTSKLDLMKAWGTRHLYPQLSRIPRSRYQEMNYRPHTAASELPAFSADWIRRLEGPR